MQGFEKDGQPEHNGTVTKINKTEMLLHLGICCNALLMSMPTFGHDK